ncbi:hypothetical protein MMC24_006817 [Lignoscripta atroalba]|nr:hypothetical protein [Lignoscripta atroalba]
MWLLPRSLSAILIASSAILGAAASSWGFGDATISVQGKGTGVGGSFKERLIEGKSLSKPVELGGSDTLKIIITTQEDKKSKRPHQAFLLVKDSTTGLETSYSFSVKESGKGKVELTHKDIPGQLLASTNSLSASLVIASFGTSKPYNARAFDLKIKADSGFPIATPEKPLRYAKLPEIHHTFKADPKSPPKIISIVFTAVVITAVPVLLITWLSLGANVNHLSNAFGTSPISHALFFSSILAMEGIFFMYYTTWNLSQTLPAAVAVGSVTFLSGSRALSEVQGRRLAGLR